MYFNLKCPSELPSPYDYRIFYLQNLYRKKRIYLLQYNGIRQPDEVNILVDNPRLPDIFVLLHYGYENLPKADYKEDWGMSFVWFVRYS